jgi:hypothetical protein
MTLRFGNRIMRSGQETQQFAAARVRLGRHRRRIRRSHGPAFANVPRRAIALATVTGRRVSLLLLLAPLVLAGWDSSGRMTKAARGDRVLQAHVGTATGSDPPLLIPWSTIGNIALGASKTRVESEYGSEGTGYHVLQRNGGATQGYYWLHGSRVIVTFYGSRVGELDFTTPYYRTKNGFGVGSTIPSGPCHRTATGQCEHRWHGFVFDAWNKGTPCNCWVKVGLGAESLPATTANFLKPWFIIYTSHRRVTEIYFALKFID